MFSCPGFDFLDWSALIDGEWIPPRGKPTLHSVFLHFFLQRLRQAFGAEHVEQGLSIEPRSQLTRGASGDYGSIAAYAVNEAVAPLAAETASIRLEDLA